MFWVWKEFFWCVSCVSLFVLVCWNCFWCLPSQSSSAFLQMGQFGPHLHHSGFGAVALRVGWSCSWGSIFIGSIGFVVVAVLEMGGIGQSFLRSKRFPDIFPALAQGVLAWTGGFSNGGGLFSDIEGFWPSEFTVASACPWGGYTVTLLGSGLANTFTLYFFVGINLFLFSVALESFLMWGLVSGWRGPNWLDCGWVLVPPFPLAQGRSSFS